MIIAAFTNVPQSGKSTFCDYLCDNYNFERLTLAAPVKETLRVLLKFRGISDERIDTYLYGDKKEEVIPEIGMSGRQLMTGFAHDFVRGQIDEDFFVDCLPTISPNKNYVIEDMRYLNELGFVRYKDGLAVFIDRYENKTSNLPNEGLLTIAYADYILDNRTTLADFYDRIDRFIYDTRVLRKL
jgi:hypothetical protein